MGEDAAESHAANHEGKPSQCMCCEGCFTWDFMVGQKGEGEENATDSRNQGKELRLKPLKPLARRGGTCHTEETLAVNLQ